MNRVPNFYDFWEKNQQSCDLNLEQIREIVRQAWNEGRAALLLEQENIRGDNDSNEDFK